MSEKKIQGWNPTYFGEPKKGSLAATIADITSKQNDQVGGKPEVQDSVVVQAEKLKQTASEGKLPPALQKAIDAKKGKEDKKEDDAKDKRKENEKDAKGEEKPIKVHGEKFEQAKQFKVQSMHDALKKVYGEAAKEKEDKEKEEEGNAFGKALMAAKEKGEKTFTVNGKEYDVKKEEDKLDPVNKVAVKKKFADRKDKDIDNDGDVDSTDKYLHKRRKAISKEID